MSMPRATSVTEAGQEDNWKQTNGWYPERTPMGDTRIVCSVKPADLPRVHQALITALKAPIGVLYRQRVNRKSVEQDQPGPSSETPTSDYVALEMAPTEVLGALTSSAGALYEDARSELWLRGALQEQVVLDADGILFIYPDDPCFHDVLNKLGVPEEDVETLAERDYVKHWFHAEHDEQEELFITNLSLTMVPTRR